MALLPSAKATPDRILMESDNYARLTDIFGVPRQETKDLEGTIVSVLDIEIDTNLFTTRLQHDELHKKCELSAPALNKQRMTLLGVQMLTCFLSFCAKAVRLGLVFM